MCLSAFQPYFTSIAVFFKLNFLLSNTLNQSNTYFQVHLEPLINTSNLSVLTCKRTNKSSFLGGGYNMFHLFMLQLSSSSSSYGVDKSDLDPMQQSQNPKNMVYLSFISEFFNIISDGLFRTSNIVQYNLTCASFRCSINTLDTFCFLLCK